MDIPHEQRGSHRHVGVCHIRSGQLREPAGGFTLIELLVVISIIGLLLSILVPALTHVNDQARAVVCQARVRQWGLAWAMYLDDNNRRFPQYLGYTWMKKLREYYANDAALLYCPTTTRTRTEGAPIRYAVIEDENGNRYGSYALNEWIYDSDHRDEDNYWRHSNYSGLSDIPVMADASWRSDGQPYETDDPPDYEGQPRTSVGSGGDEMRIFCINRHNGGTNFLFMDWSVRKVSLKRLWNLKWHRNFNTNTGPAAWPSWMSSIGDE